jgi:ankyrin repeat protein
MLLDTAIHNCKWNEMLHLLETNNHTGVLSSDYETSLGFTPLIMALGHKRPSIARKLLADMHASVDYETKDGKTAVCVAIVSHDIDGLRLCLEYGANAQLETKEGQILPLLLAVDKGRLDCIQVLLDAGADPNSANSDSITPLIQAALSHQYEAAQCLLERGAIFEQRGKDERTAVEWAKRCMFSHFASCLEAWHFQLQLKQHLFEPPRRVNHRMADEALCQGRLDTILSLIRDHRMSPNYESPRGITPLLAACTHGTFDHVQTLLAMGCIPTHANVHGETSIMRACQRGSKDMLLCLVNVGGSLTHRDLKGRDGFVHLTPFPALVQMWTSYRLAFRMAWRLGVPSRVAIVPIFHRFQFEASRRLDCDVAPMICHVPASRPVTTSLHDTDDPSLHVLQNDSDQ